MADTYADNDSAFGEDDYFWSTNPMFSTPAVAGTKRDAHGSTVKPAASGSRSGPSLQNLDGSEHIDPSLLCCEHCPEPCPEGRGLRPTKRRASAQRVGAYHSLDIEPHALDANCQFPDDCFEKFCQECNLDAACLEDCVVPCPAEDTCSTPDACSDPQCDTKKKECGDGCVDPDCTKTSSPEEPCFCQRCEVQPCPLGDLSNECHLAHTAPTTTGTVYCYGNAPCHFQEGFHGHNYGLESFESYPCFSNAHGFLNNGDTATQTSSAPMPVLSHSNLTSLESAFTGEPSPGPPSFANCCLDTSGDHCHIDNSCCHGLKRACGDCPSASPAQLDLWNSSMTQGNGLATSFMNFDLSSHATSPVPSAPFHHNLDNSVMSFNNSSWMFADPTLSASFQDDMNSINKLDFLAAAVQQDLLPSTSAIRDDKIDIGNAGETSEAQEHVCRWQNAPNALCLATFSSPEALHKHTKTAHVDNCSACFCQWQDCDVCTKDFKQRSKLSRHLLGHAGYRPYACSYPSCTKTFATNQAKDNHERTHTGERPYVCDRCGYTTTTQTQLQTHISALHEGKKPHKCRFCDFTCADSSVRMLDAPSSRTAGGRI
ncbi:zinc-finger protein [Pleosporales sp. CAS-2024a]